MKDPFWQLDIDPIAFATNPKVLGGYLTQMGLIKQRTETGLTFRSQRRLAKAIKRARMMGVIPVFSKPGSEIKMATLKDTRGNRPSF
jgi:small subunit ribosomal protein S18